ncbi:hypothetical protein [Streptomyces sp. RTd22]|nr:hypothetical protein [Streptomyces sp. RTd22]
MLELAAYMALVVTTTAVPLGSWVHTRRPSRCRDDRQLLALIHHNRRNAR